MKKKAIAWTAAVLIVALVSAAFLRPADERPDFGGVAPLYTLGGSVEITDCEGDTDVVRAVSYSLSALNGLENCTVWLDTDRVLAHTSRKYQDGKLVHDGGVEYEAGMVERLVDGEWVEEYGFDSGTQAQLSAGSASYGQISPEYEIVHLTLEEPGLYRITHYFRDNVSSERFDYETGGTLYTITHTIEVPEPSGRAGDVYGVMMSERLQYPSRLEGYRRVVIRFGLGGKEIYRDRSRMTLEKLVGSEWVEVEDISEETPAILYTAAEDDEYRYIGFSVSDTAIGYLYIDDPEALYRLTLEFVENEDGSGERYTLTLNLKFSRES